MKALHALSSASLRTKLLLLNAIVLLALVLLALQAWHSLSSQDVAQRRQVELADALSTSRQADMLHDAIHAGVLGALLVGLVPDLTHEAQLARVRADVQAMDEALRALAHAPLNEAQRAHLSRTQEVASEYSRAALAIARDAADGSSRGLAGMPAFGKQFQQLVDLLHEQGTTLSTALQQAQAEAGANAGQARTTLLLNCLLTMAGATLLVGWVTLEIRRRLAAVRDVASAVADGDLQRRTGARGHDELGALGQAIDRMAENLGQLIATARAESHQAAFSRRLGDALDVADREPQVSAVASRAMAVISSDHAMELLVADASRAQMERAAEHPGAGAPGCRVGSPYDCVAVRRGNAVAFPDSEALDACEHLRGRACGSVSAVCVPVTFMGRALGVLHAAGPAGQPLAAAQRQQLGVLASQLGTRVGTVRAFEKTQIQAATDALTGLPNRRTLEARLRVLAQGERRFAFVMCDLDRFKLLNDTHGHAAGDTALRLFADVLRQSLRDSDIAGRWGGEEFAFVLAEADAGIAVAAIERLRRKLASALGRGKTPVFTASFGIADTAMTRRVDQLVQLADVALYQAKAEGRDRACTADPSVTADDQPQRAAEQLGNGLDAHAVMAEA